MGEAPQLEAGRKDAELPDGTRHRPIRRSGKQGGRDQRGQRRGGCGPQKRGTASWGYGGADKEPHHLQAVAARGAGIPQGGYQGRRNHKAARSGRPESRVPGAGQQKARLYEQYCVKRELKEYGIIKQNVDSILRVTPGKAQAQEL